MLRAMRSALGENDMMAYLGGMAGRRRVGARRKGFYTTSIRPRHFPLNWA
jgi:hypothetical protein